MTRSSRCVSSLATAVLLSGCASVASSSLLDPRFPDNQPSDVERVLERLAKAPARSSQPVAVGVSGDPEQLYAVDVAGGRMLWKKPVTARSAPHVAGDMIVIHEDRGIVGRRLSDGAEVYTVDDEALHLIGADGDGTWSALVLSTGSGVAARAKLVVANQGHIAWQAQLDSAAGVPAVHGGMLFLPWSSQNVSVFDCATKSELARIRINTVLSHAIASGKDIYLGDRELIRLTPAVVSGKKESVALFTPVIRELPGNPRFLRDAYQPPLTAKSALHRVRIDWTPTGSGEEVGVADDNLYLTFYRLIFALDPKGESVRWVHSHDSDVVGAVAREGGVLLADENGALTFLGSEKGRPRWTFESGMEPVVVRFRMGDFAPSGEPTEEPAPLHEQLLLAAQSADSRLVPVRVLAVEMLNALPGPEVTSSLIVLCEENRAPPAVRTASCHTLGERKSGADVIVAALERHADFLKGTHAPPVAPLARAAGKMKAAGAAPQLVAHLNDPQTETKDLAAVLTALKELGDRSTAEPIRDFLRLYHADVPSAALIEALRAAIDALVALEGPAAEETLRAVVDDSMSIPQVRGLARTALEAMTAERNEDKTKDGDEDEDEEADDDDDEGSEETAEAELPMHVTSTIVRRVLAPVENQLKTCLLSDPARPRSVRVVLMLRGDGSIRSLAANPASVLDCIGPLIRAQKFPGNRRGVHQQIIHTIRR